MRFSYLTNLSLALFGFLLGYCSSSYAAQPLTDISILGSQSDAVVRIVNQGIMTPLSPGLFGPQETDKRRQFAVAVQRMFRLAPLQKAQVFHDVPSTDPDFGAINAVAPFMQAQAFCPGCALSKDFHPDAPISVTQEAVTLSSVLNSRHQVELVSRTNAASVLAPAANLSQIAAPAKVFLATAVQNGIVSLDDLTGTTVGPVATRATTAVMLDAVQQKFKISVVPQP